MNNTAASVTTTADVAQEENPNTPHPEQKCGCVTNVYCEKQEHAGKGELFGHACHQVFETCTFDIYMSRLRVLDNNDGYAELQVYPTVNGHVAAWPGPTTWAVVHEKHGWRITNQYVTSITIKSGGAGFAHIGGGAIEVDRMLGGNWEEGDGQNIQVMRLQCGQDVAPVYVDIDCHRVKEAIAGQTTAKIQLEFRAYSHMQTNIQTHAS
jgi:hypothetical protein